jgi:D-3-phosphoglycerate dehydrogenase
MRSHGVALARQIPQADLSTQAGKWEKNRFMGVEITGKVLGIIGCGTIGSIVASRAIGLHMRVIAYDPFLSSERALDLGVEKVGLETLLARADFITLHTPLTAQTKTFFGGKFAKTKKVVTSIARGGSPTNGPCARPDSGCGGRGLRRIRTRTGNRKSAGHPNAICTPHLALDPRGARKRRVQVASQMDYLTRGDCERSTFPRSPPRKPKLALHALAAASVPLPGSSSRAD